MTICYCSTCLVVRTFIASICSIVALSIMTECLILSPFPLLMFSRTGTLGCGSLLYYAVSNCIIHHRQSLMIEKTVSKILQINCLLTWPIIQWSSLHSTAFEAWNFI